MILNNGEGDLEKPNPKDSRREAALRLAIAEERYQRAFHKIGTHSLKPNFAQSVVNNLYDHTMNLIDGHIH